MKIVWLKFMKWSFLRSFENKFRYKWATNFFSDLKCAASKNRLRTTVPVAYVLKLVPLICLLFYFYQKSQHYDVVDISSNMFWSHHNKTALLKHIYAGGPRYMQSFYLRLCVFTNGPFYRIYPLICSLSWSFRIHYMRDIMFGPYISHITRSACTVNQHI